MSKFVKFLLVFLYTAPAAFLLLALVNEFFTWNRNYSVIKTDPSKSINDTKISSTEDVKLIFTGDVMLGRTVMTKSEEKGSWIYPVEKVSERLSKADVTFVNLENPIIKDCPVHTSGITFCSPPESIEALSEAGVGIVTLANNHTVNYGTTGLKETVEFLEKEDVVATGLGVMQIVDIKNTKLGFIGLDLVTNEISDEMTSLIKESTDKVDLLIIGIHWGAEYQPEGGSMQRLWAREFVASGADLIVGHHPHWVQDAECVQKESLESVSSTTRDKLMTRGILSETCPKDSVRVYYSLGNFIFDQMWSEETREGLAVEITLENGKIVKEEMLPIYMQNWAQPEWMTVEERE